MKEDKLQEKTIRQNLKSLIGWNYENNSLSKTFKFDNFSKAIAYMVEASILIEQSNHHPEWLNVYNSLQVKLTTHDSGGVTQKDFNLATDMDRLFESY